MINLKAQLSNPMTIVEFSRLGDEIIYIEKIVYLHQISKVNPRFLVESIYMNFTGDRKEFWSLHNREFTGSIKKVNYNSPMELCLFFENIEVTVDLIELLNDLIQSKLKDSFIEKYFPMIHGDLEKSNFKVLFEGPGRSLHILRGFGFVFRAIAC